MVTTINSLAISICTITCLLLLHLIKMFIWSKPPGCKLVRAGIKLNHMISNLACWCYIAILWIRWSMKSKSGWTLDSRWEFLWHQIFLGGLQTLHISASCMVYISRKFLQHYVKKYPLFSNIQVLALFMSVIGSGVQLSCFSSCCSFLWNLGIGSDYLSASELADVIGKLQLHRHLAHHRVDEDRHLCRHWVCKCLRHSPTATCLGFWVSMKLDISLWPSITKTQNKKKNGCEYELECWSRKISVF